MKLGTRIGFGDGRSQRRLLGAALSIGLVVGLATATGARAATPAWSAHGSAGQVYVLDFSPGHSAKLLNSRGQVVPTQNPDGEMVDAQKTDAQGGLLFRDVPPGTNYRVLDVATGQESGPIIVHSDQAAPWDPSIYNQTIADTGYQYLTTRDGTKLSIYVHPPTSPAGVTETLPSGQTVQVGLPNGTTVPAGPDYAPPYPTLIEYSGYGYSDPAGPVNGIAALANLMGFAVVDVNMRGTGCSGGAFNFFEPLQSLDGYDVIEAIAHQPWVLDHKVGMLGISYGAISQLFVASTDPPDLEAIAPLSTIDTTATTLYPGGILNTGFAVAWAEQRQQEAEPAGRNGGQPWAWQQVENGDSTCQADQALHGEAANLMDEITANSHYNPSFADPLDPITLVNKVNVPVFMACQWEDEQTGGHCADLVQHFTGTKLKWFTFTNGAHIDSLDPYTYNDWYDFLELFVAHDPPIENQAISRAGAPLIYQEAMGVPNNDAITLPPDPVQTMPTYAGALAAFEKIPEIRVLFDNGAGTSPTGQTTAGNPYPGFQQYFSAAPVSGPDVEPGALVSGTTTETWYLQPGPNGFLGDRAPVTNGIGSYSSDPGSLPLTDYSNNTGGGGLWGDASQWQWNWKQNPGGSALSWVSAPLSGTRTVVGSGAVYVWVRSSTSDVDLQATISEVRPDGKETFVQNGWIRASERKLSTGTNNLLKQQSTLLNPIPTFTSADATPMPRGRFVLVAIPLYYEGHVYRAGSRIRLTISAPNGTQPVWSFSNTEPALGTSSRVEIAMSPTMPSSLVLPVISIVSVPTGLPACPSLRNEPCRAYVPFSNDTMKS